MAMRFSLKRCTVDELLTHRELINELTAGHQLPALHVVAQQYRDLEAHRSAMCSMLMDGAEAVGFLIARRAAADQAHTAVLDVAAARLEFRDDWSHELSALTFVEAKAMAKEMGASGLRIPEKVSGPASAALTGQATAGTGTAFFEAI
ncbi:MAG: hypothetical protein Q8L16_26900 [Hydrogenophaga sp.]|nr:hypothetical protein [Hydrogenophaga sp.]